MDLEEISPKILDTYLRAFKQGSPKPSALLNLHSVDFSAAASVEEQHYQVFDWLETRLLENLTHQRSAQNPQAKYPSLGWRQALQLDFQNTNCCLQSWSALYYRYFVRETDSFEELAQVAGADLRQFRRRLENGLKELTSVIQRSEMEAHRRRKRLQQGNSLPAPEYNELFGLDQAKNQLKSWLTQPGGPQMLSIEGLGGIGKTTLARALVNDLLENGQADFQDVLWVSARQATLTMRGDLEALPQFASTLDDLCADLAQALGLGNLGGLARAEKLAGIHAALSLQPYLVVVDNLETMRDARAVVPMFRKVLGQARFIFTSRKSLGVFPYVQVYTVPELSEINSRKLIEAEINRRGKKFSLSDAAAQKIFAHVGGLPLALKLLAAQIFELPEDYVLDHLGAHVLGKSRRNLYTYIYRETWKNLDDSARQLLLSMLLVAPTGDSLTWIEQNSGLEAESFEPALTQLLDFSLLEVQRSPDSVLYFLHRLTYTFLKSNILKEWEA